MPASARVGVCGNECIYVQEHALACVCARPRVRACVRACVCGSVHENRRENDEAQNFILVLTVDNFNSPNHIDSISWCNVAAWGKICDAACLCLHRKIFHQPGTGKQAIPIGITIHPSCSLWLSTIHGYYSMKWHISSNPATFWAFTLSTDGTRAYINLEFSSLDQSLHFSISDSFGFSHCSRWDWNHSDVDLL